MPVGDASGINWKNACSLSVALNSVNSANFDQSIKQIWVAAGTYTPQHAPDGSTTDKRDRAFVLEQNVKMYGGFEGWEQTLAERGTKCPDASPCVSILSGNLGKDTNAYHVFVGMGLDSTSLLDGFTVSGGKADGKDSIVVQHSHLNTYTDVPDVPYIVAKDRCSSNSIKVFVSPTDFVYFPPCMDRDTVIKISYIQGDTLLKSTEITYYGVPKKITLIGSAKCVEDTLRFSNNLLNLIGFNSYLSPCMNRDTIIEQGNITTTFKFHSDNVEVIVDYGVRAIFRWYNTYYKVYPAIVDRYSGGGIHLINSFPILTNLRIDGNKAKNGGGVYSVYSNPKLINSFITNNTAENGSAYYEDYTNSYPFLPYPRIWEKYKSGDFTDYRFAIDWVQDPADDRIINLAGWLIEPSSKWVVQRRAGWYFNDIRAMQNITAACEYAFLEWWKYLRRIDPVPFYDTDNDGAGPPRGVGSAVEEWEVISISQYGIPQLDNQSPSLPSNGDGPIVIHRYLPKQTDASGNPVSLTHYLWLKSEDIRAKAFKEHVAEIESVMAEIKASPLYSSPYTATNAQTGVVGEHPIRALYNSMADVISYNPPLEDCKQRAQFDILTSGTKREVILTLMPKVTGFLYEYYMGYIPYKEDYYIDTGPFAFPWTTNKPTGP
ncbi:hypothetical protein FACS1894121_0200 [Bacteroidia bacterium]|nr:hypothetical protein FACS1894121_0200 [Bacteroidia bacterium]